MPSPPVTVTRSNPVAGPCTVTVTPGSAAPLWSVTTTSTVASAVCARAGVTDATSAARTTSPAAGQPVLRAPIPVMAASRCADRRPRHAAA